MIRVENLWKSFPGSGPPVLQGASFEVKAGQTFALIGQSGSGKSVLLRHLIGLERPDAGRVLIGRGVPAGAEDSDSSREAAGIEGATDLAALSGTRLKALRRRFGVLFQGGALFDSMSALENVAFPLRMQPGERKRSRGEEGPTKQKRWREGAAYERARECLAMVELTDAQDRRPAALSGGQKKRVALARAIAAEPDYLFCDEPNSGLDPETAAQVDALLGRLTRHLDMTTVVVTHDMRSVLTIAGRVGFLGRGGRMRFVGTPEALRRAEDPLLRRFLDAGTCLSEDAPRNAARGNGAREGKRQSPSWEGGRPQRKKSASGESLARHAPTPAR